MYFSCIHNVSAADTKLHTLICSVRNRFTLQSVVPLLRFMNSFLHSWCGWMTGRHPTLAATTSHTCRVETLDWSYEGLESCNSNNPQCCSPSSQMLNLKTHSWLKQWWHQHFSPRFTAIHMSCLCEAQWKTGMAPVLEKHGEECSLL